MLIAVMNLKDGSGKSTCAVNLACELAGPERPDGAKPGEETNGFDRWQGSCTVLLSMLLPKATHYCSCGFLPVSCEHQPLEESKMQIWFRRIREFSAQVDYVVVDSDGYLSGVTEELLGISDLVVVPCSRTVANLDATTGIMKDIRAARAKRPDGGPKCLLVPSRVNSEVVGDGELAIALSKLGEPMGPALHDSDAFENAFRAGRWIGDFAPDSSAHRDIQALAACVRLAIGA